MRRLLTILLGGMMASMPGWGQRTSAAGHSISAGHASGPAMTAHSFSPSGSSPRNFATAPHYNWGSRPTQARPAYSSPTGPAPFGGVFPPGERAGGTYPGGRHDRDRYRPYYYPGGVYAFPGWIGTGLWDYSDTGYGYGDNSTQEAGLQPANGAPADVASGNGEPQYGAPAPPFAPREAYTPEASAPASVPDQPETTLVFKDGRTPQQVQSYAVTSSTLYVLDGARRREIPLSQIDLPATQRTNRDAGVDFDVPVSAN